MEEEIEEVITDQFLKEVKDRAQALSKNATQETTTWSENEQNMDTEGDDEKLTYLARIRDVGPTGQVHIQIGSFDLGTEEGDEALNFASSSVSHTSLDLEAQRFKVALAQRRVQKRKKPVKKQRWSYAVGDELVFEIQTTPNKDENDETIMEGEEDDQEEEVPEVQFSKKARITLLKSTSPGMSLNLLADLNQALKKPRENLEVDLPTRPKSMITLGQEKKSYSPPLDAHKIFLHTQIKLKTTELKEKLSSPSLSPPSIRSSPPKEMRPPPVAPKKIIPSPPRSQYKKESPTESLSQSPPSKGSPPAVPLKNVSSRYPSLESPGSSLPGSPSMRVPWTKKALKERQDSEIPPLAGSPILPRNVEVNFGAIGGKSSSAALVKAAASSKKFELAKEEKNEEEEPHKPAWLQELDRKKLVKEKVETPEKSVIVFSIEPEWVAKVQKHDAVEDNMTGDSKVNIGKTDSRAMMLPDSQDDQAVTLDVCVEPTFAISKAEDDPIGTTIHPVSDKKEATIEAKHETKTRPIPAWLRELGKKKQAMAKMKVSEKPRPKTMFEPNLSTDEPDWMRKVKNRDIGGGSMDTDDLVMGSEQANVPVETFQDEKAVNVDIKFECGVKVAKPENTVVVVEKHLEKGKRDEKEEKQAEEPQKSSWLQELNKKRQRREKNYHERPRPKSMFEPSTATSEPEWIVKLKKRSAAKENVEIGTNQVEPEVEPTPAERPAASELKTERNLTICKAEEQPMVTTEEQISELTVKENSKTVTLLQDYSTNADIVVENVLEPSTNNNQKPGTDETFPTVVMVKEFTEEKEEPMTVQLENTGVTLSTPEKYTLITVQGGLSADDTVLKTDVQSKHSILGLEDNEAPEIANEILRQRSQNELLDGTVYAFPDKQEREKYTVANPPRRNLSRDNSTETEKRITPVEMDFVITEAKTSESDNSAADISGDNMATDLQIPLTNTIEVTKRLPDWVMKARIRSGEYQKLADECQAKALESVSVTGDDRSSGSSSPQKASGSSSPEKSSVSSSPEKTRRRRGRSLVNEAEKALHKLKQDYPDKTVLDQEIRELAGFSDSVIGRNSDLPKCTTETPNYKETISNETVIENVVTPVVGKSDTWQPTKETIVTLQPLSPKPMEQRETKASEKQDVLSDVSFTSSHQNVDPKENRSDSNIVSVEASRTREELPKVMRRKLIRVNSFEREKPAKIDFYSSPEGMKYERKITKDNNDSAKDRNLKNETEEAKEFKPKKRIFKTKLRSKKSVDDSTTCTELKIDEISKDKQSNALEHSKENESSVNEPSFPDVLKWSKKIDNVVCSNDSSNVKASLPTNTKDNAEKKDNNMNIILNNRNKSNSQETKDQRPSSLLIEDVASNGNIHLDTGKSKIPVSMLIDKKQSSWSEDLRSMDTVQPNESLKSPMEETKNLLSPTQDKTSWMTKVFERKSSIDNNKENSVIPEWKRKLLARKKESLFTSPVQESPRQKPIPPPKSIRPSTTSSDTKKPVLTRSPSETSKARWFQMNRRPSGGSDTPIDCSDLTSAQNKDVKPPSFLEEFKSKKEARIKKAHTAPSTRRNSISKDEPEWLLTRRSIINDSMDEPTSEEWL